MKRILFTMVFLVVCSPAMADERGEAILAQPDGTLVMAGVISKAKKQDIFIAFLNREGKETKKIITDLGGNEGVYGISLRKKNGIVVAGYSEKNKKRFPLLVFYSAEGKMETFTETDLGDSAEIHFMAIQPDQKIVVTGFTTSKFFLIRYLPNGALDPTFGDQGIVLSQQGQGEKAFGLALQKDGKMVVAGSLIARTLPSGKLDLTFGSGGFTRLELGPGQNVCSSVAIQKDGKILVAGFSMQAKKRSDIFVARLNTDGALDKSWNQRGWTLYDHKGGYDVAHALQPAPNGKILVAGEVGLRKNRMALLRFHPNGIFDTLHVVEGSKKGNASAEAMTLSRNGTIWMTGYAGRRWIVETSNF